MPRDHDFLGWRGDHEAASKSVAQASNSHHRLVSPCHEDPTNIANRGTYCGLPSGRPVLSGMLAVIDKEIKALKWNLWHGQVDRAISALDRIVADMDHLGQNGDLSAPRLHSLSQQLLTYIRLNRTAIVDYGARYRSGRRIATSLAESPVNSLVAKRMVKNQQMRWSQRGAHLMLQVRTAMINGTLRQRLREQLNMPAMAVLEILQPTPPLLRAA